MQNSTTGDADKTLIVRESLKFLNTQSQWEGETTDGKSVYLEIYCGSLRVTFSEVGENVFIARENCKSNDYQHDVELPANTRSLSISQLISLLEESSLITQPKEEDENDTSDN